MEINKQYRIIVAHAERQHSFYLATAMKEMNWLYRYITTIYDRPQSLTNRVKHFLKGNTLKKAGNRRCEALDDRDILQINELMNLIITYLSRYPIFRDLCRYLRDINGKVFGKKVAKYAIAHNVDAVIMFDGYAYSCFEYIKRKKSNILCILDVTIMSRPYTSDFFTEIANRTNDSYLRKENFYLYDKRFRENYLKEYKYGDFFLAGSNIVKKSIEFCSVEPKRIERNPYGVDTAKFFAVQKNMLTAPLRIIVVGQLNRRKGIHQLLEVISQYSPNEVFLELVGGYENTSDIYIKYKYLKNVCFHGFVTHDILFKLYQNSHVFVLPSFAEGMALVGLEAMASGLPLLCSNCTGVNDLVIPYVNGIVTQAGVEGDIKQGIDWFIVHLNDIPEMGKAARKTAEEYTWKHYYARTQKIIDGWIDAERGRYESIADYGV